MTSLLNMCSNCGKYEVAKTHLCGFNDWCEECDISLWSTRDETTTNEVTSTTTATKYEEIFAKYVVKTNIKKTPT